MLSNLLTVSTDTMKENVSSCIFIIFEDVLSPQKFYHFQFSKEKVFIVSVLLLYPKSVYVLSLIKVHPPFRALRVRTPDMSQMSLDSIKLPNGLNVTECD
jgi:hypothetical protein